MIDTTELPTGPGPAVAAHIDTVRGDESVREWAARHGLDDARISSWRRGAAPTLDGLRAVADALGLSIADVLVIAGLATAAEFTLRAPAPPPDVDVAIAADPSLSAREREALGYLRDVLRGVPDEGPRMRATRRRTYPIPPRST